MRLRRKLANSAFLNEAAATVLYLYIRFCHVSTKWEISGFEEMDELLLQNQPIILVIWHERLIMSPYMFNTRVGKICAITTESKLASMGKRLLRLFQFEAEQIDPKKNPTGFNRKVLHRIRAGYSIAISPDGTRGPARIAKPFPIKWSRKTGAPIFCATFAVRRKLTLSEWSKAHIPLPFNRGALLIERWHGAGDKPISNEDMQSLTTELGASLDEITRRADLIVQN